MTQDEIIEMAREVCMEEAVDGLFYATSDDLQRFAALVAAKAAAKERESCAQICDTTYYQFIGPEFGEVRHGIAACAAAIRSRSTT